MRIRLARPQDLYALKALSFDADQRFLDVGHPELATPDGFSIEGAKRLIDEERIKVVEFGGGSAFTEEGERPIAAAPTELVGFITFEPLKGSLTPPGAAVTDEHTELCIGQVSVTRRFARRRIGSILLRTVLAEADEVGEPSIVLNTQADVPWNRPWYEKWGFVVVPRDAWSDALVRIADGQAKAGLDWSTRVHMRRMRPPPELEAEPVPSVDDATA